MRQLYALGLAIVASQACTDGDTGSPDTDADTTFIGFNLMPSTIVLQPGECMVSELVWSGGTLLSADEVEWSAHESLRIDEVRPGFFRFCAGDLLGDGDITVRLAGRGQFFFAGRGFVRLPPDRDRDPLEADWAHGQSGQATSVFWSDDGDTFFAVWGEHGVMDEYRASDLAHVATHLIHSQFASPLGDRRVAVVDFNRVGTYNIAERSYETWYNSQTFQPDINSGDDVVIGANNGRIASITYDGRGNQCTNALVDLAGNDRTIIEQDMGRGFVPESGARGGDWGGSPVVVPPYETYTHVTPSGRYVIYGDRSCWTGEGVRVDMQTQQIDFECIPEMTRHKPVMSADGRTLLAIAPWLGGTEQIQVIDIETCDTLSGSGVPLINRAFGMAISPNGELGAFVDTADNPETFVWTDVLVTLVDLTTTTDGSFPRLAQTQVAADHNYNGTAVWKHRVAFSPSGDDVAIAMEHGRIGTMDVNTHAARMNDLILWNSALPTPHSGRVLAQVQGPLANYPALIDADTGLVLTRHSTLDQLVATLPDGYVIRNPGNDGHTLHDYDAGEGTPYSGDVADALDYASTRISADGNTSCSIGAPPHSSGTGQLCVNGTCGMLQTLTNGQTSSAIDCMARDSGGVLFLAGGSLWSWAPGAELAVHWSMVPDSFDDLSGMYSRSDTDLAIRTRSHMMHWSL